MRQPHFHAPVDAQRRRLLLALPGSLAMASPLAFVACGGSGDSTDPEAESAARVKAIAARLPAAQRSAAAVAVTLPAGTGVALADTNLVTANNVAQVAADGTSGAVLVEGAAQMAYLFDKAGRLLLMGIVEPGQNDKIDSRTTAEALVLLASQATLLGDAPATALRQVLRTHDLVLPVQQAVEAAAARGGIDPTDTGLMAALDGALKTLFPRPAVAVARARPNGVKVQPGEMQSGLTVPAENGEYNTVRFQNSFRRRTHVWIAQDGQYDDAGTLTPIAPPLPLTDFDLNATTPLSFDNFVVAVGDFLAELAESIGALDPYDSGAAPWTPVASEPVTLPLLPAGASAARYAARVVGVGATAGGTLSAAESKKLDELWGTTFYYDVVVPLVKTLILPLIGEGVQSSSLNTLERFATNALLSGALDLTSIEVAAQTLPATVAAMKAGDAQGVITNFFFEFLGSNTLQTFIAELFTAMVQAADPRDPTKFASPDLRDSTGKLIGVNVLDDVSLMRRNIQQLQSAATKLARIIAVAKAVATAADYAAMVKDWNASSRLVEFRLDVSSAKVRLSPDPVTVDPLAGANGKGAITATLEGLDANLAPENVFLSWHCTGRYGNLLKRGADGTNDFESTLDNPTHDYFPDGSEDNPDLPDTVTVTAYYRNPTTNARVQLSLANVQIKFKKLFTVSVSPAGPVDVPTGVTMSLTGFLNETLPTGATVEWLWSNAGVGTLGTPPAGGDARSSIAPFTTGEAQGRATATVRARVSVPATATTPAIVVTTNPVNAVLDVKKGQRTITFVASGGVFPCGAGCGVTDYTAYIVPRIPNATLYTAVFTEFGYGPCNRSVSWTAPKGDGGGCNFPITYHPIQVGEAATAWAVWIGFGGPLTGPGKCTVTITLPA